MLELSKEAKKDFVRLNSKNLFSADTLKTNKHWQEVARNITLGDLSQ